MEEEKSRKYYLKIFSLVNQNLMLKRKVNMMNKTMASMIKSGEEKVGIKNVKNNNSSDE